MLLRKASRHLVPFALFLGAACTSPSSSDELDGIAEEIVGGEASGPAPFMVAVEERLRGEWGILCAGTIIGQRWVLTVAHCVTNFESPTLDETSPDRLRVIVGDLTLGKIEAQWSFVGVTHVLRHPKFSGPPSFEHDLALLRLDRSVSPSRILELDDRDLIGGGDLVTALGWGVTTPQEYDPTQVAAAMAQRRLTPFELGGSNTLRAVELKALTHADCLAMLDAGFAANGQPEMRGADFLTTRMICGVSPDDKPRGFCSGDSGGPALVRDGRGRRVQVGMVSWSPACGDSEFPHVFVRMASWTGWVRDRIALWQSYH